MKLKSACSGAWIALLAAAVDRVGKSLMLRHEPGEIVRVIPGIVQFRRTANTGMAFSLCLHQFHNLLSHFGIKCANGSF